MGLTFISAATVASALKSRVKPVIAFLTAWPLYWIGDGVSRIIQHVPDDYERLGDALASMYQSSMGTSVRIEEWAGTQMIWKPADEEDPQ